MIVSHRHRVILFRGAKLGGTSVAAALRSQLGPEDIDATSDGHAPPSRIAQQHPEAWRDYLRVTLVRNPWDLAVSIVAWVRTARNRGPWRALHRCTLCGGEVWAKPRTTSAICRPCGKRSAVHVADSPTEIAQWMRDNFERVILESESIGDVWVRLEPYVEPHATRPHYNLDQYFWDGDRFLPDVTLRFEQLGADYAALCERLGIANRLQHLNGYRYRDASGYRSYYSTREAVDKVGAYFARIVDHYGYDF